jgi:hypothetical protein
MRLPVVLSFLSVLLVAPAVPGATPQDVEQALVKAKQYVYSQHKNGTWEKSEKPEAKSQDKLTGSQWGGQTALAAYALLAASDNPNAEPKLAEAIKFLKGAKVGGTYALGVRCQVWALLPQTPEVKALMRRDATALQTMMKTQGNAKGFYDYDARGSSYSLSRAQYAVLGMWGAAGSGAEVPLDYWRKVDAAWTGAQESDGGWRYQKGAREYPVTAGMTAAGVATLLVAQEYLLADSVACNGNPAAGAIDRGLAWLDQHFDQVAAEQEYEREYPFATLYAVERVGVASGLKYFGRNDWYQKGADYLVKRQKSDGSWKGNGSYFGALPDTCFGILFLARGRAPLLMNKLQHGDQAEAPADRSAKPDALAVLKKLNTKVDWNQRPRDVANLANWVSTVAERDLNWQVLGPSASLRDLHDAPILYLSGTQPPKLGEETKSKLRQYVEGGGMIVANADCGGKHFAAAIQKLGSELFPKYAFRELPADHVLYTGGVFRRDKWKSRPSVLGLSNGVRELMLLVPQADAGRVWQSRVVGGKEEAWQLGADVFFYAAGRKDLRYRGESHYVEADPKLQPAREITVARLEYNGNWDPEPGGWRRLAALLNNERQVKLSVRPVKLGAWKLGGEIRLAHLTGTAAFKLDADARNELRKFIQSGGTLLVDAAGGSAAFADAAEAEVKALFPDARPAILPVAHPLYSSGAAKLEAVAYRPFAQRVVGGAKAPRLQAVTVGRRPAVFVSREDLSAGLVGHSVDGVIGYDPRSATEIMTRLVLFATGGVEPGEGKAPEKKPDLPF